MVFTPSLQLTPLIKSPKKIRIKHLCVQSRLKFTPRLVYGFKPSRHGMEGSEETSNSVDFIDKKSQQEESLWRIKKASDLRRHKRVQSIVGQQFEGWKVTLGRPLYLIFCILFDGLILTEIPIRLGRTVPSWILFGVILGYAVMLQKQYYDQWFDVDLTGLDMN